MSSVESTSGLAIERVFTSPGEHPFDTIEWVRSDVVLKDWRSGETIFEQLDVEFPAFWSQNARQIVTSKYFRGALGTEAREWSLRQVIDRVVGKYTRSGAAHGYFKTDADVEAFSDEMCYMLVHQMFSFNSPVWFNVGTASPQQVSACFLLSVEDSMEDILAWYREEGLIFKGGSGSGINLSKIRSSKELLSSGGTASGPVSFMRGADASAGAIKSGGSTRRAAKLVCLDVDHPDIEDFVTIKAREEAKVRALAAAGFDVDLDGADSYSIQYQNANNSVRVSDEFMYALGRGDAAFPLRARLDGAPAGEVNPGELWTKIAESAWSCADPGVQFDDAINSWHTCPEDGRITTSNPCSEYMHLDNSSCNLASLNLMAFYDNGVFDAGRFMKACTLVITAMDISICFADFPTEKITQVSRAYRQLGIGYSNLGALLMSMGFAYDSAEGRAMAAAVTSLMSGAAYQRSAVLARELAPYEGFSRNASAHLAVLDRHATAAVVISGPSGSSIEATARVAQWCWEIATETAAEHGLRNAQLSLLAPTGTISFMMDCDTTGVEPDFGLVKFKKLVGGGSMQIVNQGVERALRNLEYSSDVIRPIMAYIAENGSVVGAPGLAESHYAIFDCAVGERFISAEGHIRMMAAVQPFLSGAISKTINMPAESTVSDIANVYRLGWSLGLKALAVYRDGSKGAQPLSTKKRKVEPDVAEGETSQETPHEIAPQRLRMPLHRESRTTSFSVGGAEGYLTSSRYPGNGLGEIFLKLGKQGSTFAGIMDAFSIAVSIGLQYGIPLESYVEKFTGMQFEPAGMTNDPDVRLSKSVLDYVFRRLALDYLPAETCEALGVLSAEERSARVLSGPDAAGEVAAEGNVGPAPALAVSAQLSGAPAFVPPSWSIDAPLCTTCGSAMVRAGTCYTCGNCGATSGCS